MSVVYCTHIGLNAYFLFPSYRPHAIVCGDGCFSHCREYDKAEEDPALGNPIPRTCFLDRKEVADMQAIDEALRPPETESAQRVPGEKDKKETGMKVPNSVLDLCEQAFTAADGRRAKSSKKEFQDTGLMGLVCRHDRVIYMCNMTTPGERQFYILAMIKKLFKELPSWFRVGQLYDVACQLERSLAKV